MPEYPPSLQAAYEEGYDALLTVVRRVVGDAGQILVPKTPGAVYATLRSILDQRNRYRSALTAICTANDAGPWIEVYRSAGGGYEGLQKIAETALADSGPDSEGKEGTSA